jgi:hypothetical protein
VKLDKEFVLDHLREAGESDKVQKAVEELPDKIDHEEHAAQLQKLGIDPGALAEKAVQRGLNAF